MFQRTANFSLLAECLKHLRAGGLDRIDADQAYENQWVKHVDEVASGTLFPTANSWYVGANIPGKPSIFTIYVGGFGVDREKCFEVAKNNPKEEVAPQI